MYFQGPQLSTAIWLCKWDLWKWVSLGALATKLLAICYNSGFIDELIKYVSI